MFPFSIQKLVGLFSRFPTVGPRTAVRFVFYLMRLSEQEIKELLDSISNLKKTIKTCSFCFYPFEPTDAEQNLCAICQNKMRDRNLLCVVETETDLNALEKTKKYNGLYFILGGTISNLKKETIKEIRAEQLIERIKKSNFQEIILANNFTAEGQATALYLERLLKPLTCGELAEPIKITRLGQGLPISSELEYANQETLSSALENRK